MYGIYSNLYKYLIPQSQKWMPDKQRLLIYIYKNIKSGQLKPFPQCCVLHRWPRRFVTWNCSPQVQLITKSHTANFLFFANNKTKFVKQIFVSSSF